MRGRDREPDFIDSSRGSFTAMLVSFLRGSRSDGGEGFIVGGGDERSPRFAATLSLLLQLKEIEVSSSM